MNQRESSPQLDSLAAKLSSSNVSDMATGLASDPRVDALWKEHPDPQLYATLVADVKRPEPVRFAAALVLLSKSAGAFWKLERPVLAQVFAAALKQDLAGWAFPWGWLWASPWRSGRDAGADFAAFYIARILELELPWEPDLAKRDRAIEALRKQLPAG